MKSPAAPTPEGTPVPRAGASPRPVTAARPPVGVPAMAAPARSADDDGDARPAETVARPTGGFFNQPWVQNVLPLATSLFLHVGLIVLGIALYQAVVQVVNPNKDQVIIPQTASLTKSSTPGGVKHPGPPADPTRDAMQDQTKETDNAGFAAEAGNKLAAAGGASDAAASGFLGGNSGGGKGHSFGGGAGGGGTAPWGMPGGGEGMLPKSDFMGTGGNASDVVFLCDASGSMVGVFGALKAELKKSISEMNVGDDGSVMRFNVIFFQDDNATPLFRDGMHIATPDAKKAAGDFIDAQVSVGGTNPIPAIKMALGQKPQLLYILTDGFDAIADMSTVTDEFKRGDADGKTHINCIFLQGDNPDPKLEAALKEIAAIGHGDFKGILKKDM